MVTDAVAVIMEALYLAEKNHPGDAGFCAEFIVAELEEAGMVIVPRETQRREG